MKIWLLDLCVRFPLYFSHHNMLLRWKYLIFLRNNHSRLRNLRNSYNLFLNFFERRYLINPSRKSCPDVKCYLRWRYRLNKRTSNRMRRSRRSIKYRSWLNLRLNMLIWLKKDSSNPWNIKMILILILMMNILNRSISSNRRLTPIKRRIL